MLNKQEFFLLGQIIELEGATRYELQTIINNKNESKALFGRKENEYVRDQIIEMICKDLVKKGYLSMQEYDDYDDRPKQLYFYIEPKGEQAYYEYYETIFIPNENLRVSTEAIRETRESVLTAKDTLDLARKNYKAYIIFSIITASISAAAIVISIIALVKN